MVCAIQNLLILLPSCSIFNMAHRFSVCPSSSCEQFCLMWKNVASEVTGKATAIAKNSF